MTPGGGPGGPAGPHRLRVDAALTIGVDDGRGNHAEGTLSGGDAGLRLDVDRPEVMFGALPSGRDAAGPLRWASELGVRLEVHGPDGRLAVLHPDRPSRVARLLTGQSALRPTPAAVAAWARGPGRGRVLAAAGLIGAALGAALVSTFVHRRR